MAFRGRGPRFIPPPPDAHRINRYIRVPQVRLIGADGTQFGVVPIEEALRRAEDAQLDLVEVAPTAQPPVCRILDYGKFKYQQHKKEAEARRKQATTTVKELRLGYRTDVGDLERQIQKAREFLAVGDRVKFSLRFRGREMAYQNLGRDKLMGVCDALKSRDVLDYGCGQRMLEKALGFEIHNFDPCIPGLDAPPQPADIVVCADVLEHIEPECLDEVLDDLQRLTRCAGFLLVATRAAEKTLPDGRNAHLIQQGPEWWLPRIERRFRIGQYQPFTGEFAVIVRALAAP